MKKREENLLDYSESQTLTPDKLNEPYRNRDDFHHGCAWQALHARSKSEDASSALQVVPDHGRQSPVPHVWLQWRISDAMPRSRARRGVVDLPQCRLPAQTTRREASN